MGASVNTRSRKEADCRHRNSADDGQLSANFANWYSRPRADPGEGLLGRSTTDSSVELPGVEYTEMKSVGSVGSVDC
jgi:hypothetical protein